MGVMDWGLLHARESVQPDVEPRSRRLSLSTIIIVFCIVVAAIGGFAHVTLQQQALAALRGQSQQMDAIHRALTQADADVMYFLLGDRERLERYIANIGVLNNAPAAIMGRIGARPAGEGGRPSSELINGLKNTWAQAMSLGASGQSATARQLLLDSKTGATVAAVGQAIEAQVARANDEIPQLENRTTLATLVVLLLQVGGGVLAILGLVYALRSANAEAAVRVEAVASADAAREQVVRLFDMADVLQSASDHVDANAVLKATAAELVPGFSGALYVFNNSRDRLVLSSEWGRPEGTSLPETINPNACWAVKRGKAHTNHLAGTKLCCEHHEGREAALEIPMIARGEIVGLLQLFAEGTGAEARLASVADLGQALADGMSLALANMALREKLRNQALRDPLTGLYNRRYMEDVLQRFVRLAERDNREISVVMIDLDHFKRLNDERGHAFGDQVLRETAVALLGSLRETDIVCRYGGEELVVILPDCPPEHAVDKAESLRLRIEALSGAHGAAVTASFGVASVPHTSQSLPDLLAAADAALYKAKQNGRNQVVMAPLRAFRLDRRPEGQGTVDEIPREAAE
jgi:diguanylate cyclase (GGDEF)-like protein